MKAFYWALLTALVWGMVPLLEKIGLGKTTVLTGMVLRCAGVLLGLIFLMVFKLDAVKSAFSVRPQTAVCIIAGGLLASVIGQIFFYKALKLGDVSRVVPVAAAYPLVSFVLALIFLSEKLTMAKVSGVVLVCMGIVLLK
ncbi:EamA family transporter [Candidatus Omnitrophota bacterium]